ncbi:MAG TPA: tetratricopeptide repeat protein, partial [Verrucomicrobiae bacterium]|nr:tetratricopeptide repeat protein [Verrucomicrobiae bacterium]
EDTVAKQRASDAEAARKTQQSTLFLAGAFGLAGLGIMLLMVYFQWRAFTQLAQISSQPQNALTNGHVIQQLAAPGRASVETANAQLLSVVDRLEARINELESGQKLLPEIAAAKPSDLLTEGQKHLDANAPLKALECFDKYIAEHPQRAEALVKRAAALEKLGREEEALQCYNRAITVDGSLVIAHLHKGGLLNRLRRYDEALNCYEQALLAQEKKAVTK